MKILFLTPRDSRKHIGGVETHVRLLTEELEKRGHEVEELTLCSARSLLFKLQAWRYLWQKRDLFKWADIIHIHDVFWWVLPFLPIMKKTDCHAASKARLAMTKTKVFVTFHGWEGEYPPSRSAILQKRIAKMLSRGTIGVGNFFEKWYGVSPDKVSFGVLDPKHMRLPRGRTGRYVPRNDGVLRIAFYGRLETVNGIEVALEAFRILKGRIFKGPTLRMPAYRRGRQGRTLKDMRFFFVGDGPERAKAEKIGKVTGMTETPWKFLLQSDLVITSSYLCLLETAALMRPIISIATNPLKNDYLMTHPLATYATICHTPKEIVDRIFSYQKSKKQKAKNTEDMQRAYRWTTSQTVQKLADAYIELWNSLNRFQKSHPSVIPCLPASPAGGLE